MLSERLFAVLVLLGLCAAGIAADDASSPPEVDSRIEDWDASTTIAFLSSSFLSAPQVEKLKVEKVTGQQLVEMTDDKLRDEFGFETATERLNLLHLIG